MLEGIELQNHRPLVNYAIFKKGGIPLWDVDISRTYCGISMHRYLTGSNLLKNLANDLVNNKTQTRLYSICLSP